MLVPADAFDVIPRISLMTPITLVDLNIFATWIPRSIPFAGNHLVDHFKVHHVVAGRRLMALSAVRRTRRRVLKSGNGPLRRAVACGAILPEQIEMLVLVRVAVRAIQDHLFWSNVLVVRLPSCARA